MTPIRIKVDPSHDASKVKAEGPGLSRTGKTRSVGKTDYISFIISVKKKEIIFTGPGWHIPPLYVSWKPLELFW